MEVVKQNEQFTLNKVLENGWIVEGGATKYTSGVLSFQMYFIEKFMEGDLERQNVVGEVSYSTHKDNKFDMHCNTLEANRVVLMQYINPIIDEVLDYFK